MFFIHRGSDEDLKSFEEYINQAHQTIKFTVTSGRSIPFLDVQVSIENGFLTTDLHTKATDAHNYLHQKSAHPKHTIRNLPYGMFIRLRRICSKEETFEKRCDEVAQNLLRRHHKKKDIDKARQKAKNIPRAACLQYKKKKKLNRVPFVVTHHPQNPPINRWLKQEHEDLIEDSKMEKVSPEPPITGERVGKNLKSLLMPSILPSKKEKHLGTKKCTYGKNNEGCDLCKLNLVEAQNFSSDQTGETFTVRYGFYCTSSNVIYLMYCNKCKDAQYVGETKNKLRKRFYLHRRHIEENTGTLVTQHFNLPGHTVENMKCFPIEKVFHDSTQFRRKRERFWIHKLKTLAPFGLNSKDW